MKQLPSRSEVNVKDTWALEDIYATDALWEEDFEKLSGMLARFSEYAGRLKESGETLQEALDLYVQISQTLSALYVYGTERYNQDTADSFRQQQVMRIQELSVRVSSATSFLWPELLGLSEEWIAAEMDRLPGLAFYKRAIDNVFRDKEHYGSPETEKLLSDAEELGNAPESVFSMFNNADLKFGRVTDENGEVVELTHGRFISLLSSGDRRVRKETFETYYGAYSQFRNSLAAVFAANVKQAGFFAAARKYPSARAYYLGMNHIPESVYDNLLEAVHANIGLLHRYVSLRKKMLGVEQLHMYDLYVPLTQEGNQTYTFEEAKEIVKEGLAPLGEDYLEILQEGFDHRWIDVYENRGKRSGAHSWGVYGVHPMVMLNFNGRRSDVFTLAHEMGHAIHSYYSNREQEYIYSDYKIFVAEVASTCNEALLIQDMLQKTNDPEQKLALLNHFLESYRTTLYRQTMFAEFEMKAHRMAQEGIALTAESLCRLYRELNEFYFGPDIVVDEEIALEWARIPHFYTPFYVYQYATGFSAAMAISGKIRTEGEPAVAAYKEFLKGGDSKDPIDLLRIAGVDMESRQPVETALQFFDSLLTQMEELVNLTEKRH